LSCGYDRLADVLAEARRFLGMPQPEPVRPPPPEPSTGLPQGLRRLLVTSYPLAGSLAETYLRARGIAVTPDLRALRFHPRCFYRTTDPATGANRYEAWPALLAAVTDVAGYVSRSAMCTGIEPVVLTPTLKDFNDDLRQLGVDALRTALREQLRPEDAERFMTLEAAKVEGDAVPLQPDPGEGPPAGGPRPRACEEAI